MLGTACWLPSCSATTASDPPTTITIATGRPNSSFSALGTRLAQIYSSKIPRLRAVTIALGPAELANADAIQHGTADVAFIGGDAAYSAFKRGTRNDPSPHTRLRGIAVLFSSAVQIIAGSENRIRRVTDLRGQRFAVADFQGSQTDATTRAIFEVYGLRFGDLRASYYVSMPEMAAMMRARELDGGLTFTAFPQRPIVDITQTVSVRLIPIERRQIELIQARYPFLKSVAIPRGTYTGQVEDVRTVGIDNLLVCREDLPQKLVRDLTQALFEAIPQLAQAHAAASMIDSDRGPTTPIPLHPGAAQYYRERELVR
jgi:TRAP transporter TAXI family solute receptor